MADQFYLRYYSGHVGSYGHEFLEFEVTGNRLRFALNSKSVPVLSRDSAWAIVVLTCVYPLAPPATGMRA